MTGVAGDAEALLRRWMGSGDHALLARDVLWRVSPGDPVPRTEWRGREAVAGEFFPALRRRFPVRRFPVRRVAVDASAPLADGRLAAVGAYEARDAEGREGRVPSIHLWTVRDGAVAAVEAVADFAAFPLPRG